MSLNFNISYILSQVTIWGRGRRVGIVIGFTTTYAISAYHHWINEFESCSDRWGKTDYHDITQTLLEVVLNTITPTLLFEAQFDFRISGFQLWLISWTAELSDFLFCFVKVLTCSNHKCQKTISFVNGRFRVEMSELRRVHVHSSVLVVTSNQNASNKKKIV